MAKAKDIPGLHARLPYAEAAARTVRARAEELFAISSADVLDTADIERVHDMRVASRRLRAVLEIYAPCFEPDRFRAVLADVKALADALGARRDPDVQLAALDAMKAAMAPEDHPGIDLVAQEVRAEQEQGNEVLAVALEAADASDLRGRLLELAASAAERSGHAGEVRS
jgi:CHAD domain-containing protein